MTGGLPGTPPRECELVVYVDPQYTGPVKIEARATNDSCNLGAPTAPLTVTATLPGTTFGFWNNTTTPTLAAYTDATASTQGAELGLTFTSSVSGYVTGVRFYKGPGNTGTHIGNLWSSTGTLLASATFTNESASGWQTVTFSSPVLIQANLNYVVSYHTTTGYYALNMNYFAGSESDMGPLEAPQAPWQPTG